MNAAPRLNLVVICSPDIERARSFYAALGLEFRQEQHGKGPVHYAAEMDGMVLEIYPQTDDETRCERLGFRVASLDASLASLAEVGGTIVTRPTMSPWGRRAVAGDPDGRRVELTE